MSSSSTRSGTMRPARLLRSSSSPLDRFSPALPSRGKLGADPRRDGGWDTACMDEARESARCGICEPRLDASGKRRGAAVSLGLTVISSPRGSGSPGRILVSGGGSGGRFLPTQSFRVDDSATLCPYMRMDAPSTPSSPRPMTTALFVRPVGESLGSRHKIPVKKASKSGEDVDLLSAADRLHSTHLNAGFLAVQHVFVTQGNNAAHRKILASAHTLEREAQVSVGR